MLRGHKKPDARPGTLDLLVQRSIHDVRRDASYALRMLWRNPGFSVLAILCLTLGIGANAAVFSWIEGILLRPYPLVADQDSLFAVTGTNRGAPGHTDVSWPDWLDLQRNSTLVQAFIGEKITGTTLSIGDRAERASGSMVSANYFEAIGVRPMLGRGFEPGEDAGRNAHPVTVISYQMWQDRFHGDPAIIGKTARSTRIRISSVGRDYRRVSGRVFRARVARHTDRSASRAARVMGSRHATAVVRQEPHRVDHGTIGGSSTS
jgi:hypothetical protein